MRERHCDYCGQIISKEQEYYKLSKYVHETKEIKLMNGEKTSITKLKLIHVGDVCIRCLPKRKIR